MEKEKFDVKYIDELNEYCNAYMSALIKEIYVGVGINLGLSEKEAYKLAKNKPGELKKAGFFKNIFNKFKNIFSYKIPKFRYKKKRLYDENKPMTPEQWNKFNDALKKYWDENSYKVIEDLSIKAFELGKQTTYFDKQDKPYQNKSLYQVIEKQYDGDMPDTIAKAYKNYNYSTAEKKIFNKQLSSIALYLTNTQDDVKEGVRQIIQHGIDNNKTAEQVASDLYWQVEKGDKFTNKYSADALSRDWQRVATTEMASIYESGKLAPYEEQAMESMKDPSKAQYFLRTGGQCEWCRSVRGTLVRLIPSELAGDISGESLKSIGIIDSNTDIAIWNGKNNIGRKQKDWLIATPAHPNNTATLQPINIKTEYYNPKTDSIEKMRVNEDKYTPAMKDFSERSKEKREYRKPTLISNNTVRYNNNIYRKVSPEKYREEKEKWDKDPTIPIPISTDSTRYDKIFGEAERNR